MTGTFAENGVAGGVVMLTFTLCAGLTLSEKKKRASIITMELTVSPAMRSRTSQGKLSFAFLGSLSWGVIGYFDDMIDDLPSSPQG
jgi:hypothetical protein